MITHIDIIRPEYCTRYLYSSDNVFEKHFYVSFGAHVTGVIHEKLTFLEWLLGVTSRRKVDLHFHTAYYKLRVKWYALNGRPATVDEEVALNVVKEYIDIQNGSRGGPKFAEYRKGRRGFWPKKEVNAHDLAL